MSDVQNKGSTADNELDSAAIRKELRRTVINYSKVIDLIDATPKYEDLALKTKESHSLRRLLKSIFKRFKNK